MKQIIGITFVFFLSGTVLAQDSTSTSNSGKSTDLYIDLDLLGLINDLDESNLTEKKTIEIPTKTH